MAHLAVVLPGGPFFLSAVLRVPAVALAGRGAELRDVTPPPGYNPTFELDDNHAYFAGVKDQIQTVIDDGEWDEVTFVAKSIGTMILSAVGSSLAVPREVKALWLTPTFGLNYVRDGAIETGWKSLIVSGSGDRWYDPDATSAVINALDAQHLVVDRGDHNLEIAGEVQATVHALEELAAATLAFID